MRKLLIDAIDNSTRQEIPLCREKRATMWSRPEVEEKIKRRGVKLDEYDFFQAGNFLDGTMWEYRKKMVSTYSGPDRITVCID